MLEICRCRFDRSPQRMRHTPKDMSTFALWGAALTSAAAGVVSYPLRSRLDDALHLALWSTSMNTAVRIPSAVQKACRDLARAREDARGDLTCSRQRISKHLVVWASFIGVGRRGSAPTRFGLPGTTRRPVP